MNPFLRKATKSSEKLFPYKNRKPTSRDTECYAGHATQHEKLYCPDRPVPPKLEMNISPEDLIQSPAEYSRSLLATTHRCRSWVFGLKPSGTVPICSPLHDPEILAHMTQSAVKSHNGPADRLQSVGGACR